MRGALDKEITFNKITLKCDPRKKEEKVDLEASKRNEDTFSWKR